MSSTTNATTSITMSKYIRATTETSGLYVSYEVKAKKLKMWKTEKRRY